jgi:hypothetical protein
MMLPRLSLQEDHMHRPYSILDPDEIARWDRAMRRSEDLRCGVETDDDDNDQVEEDETAGD